MDNIKVLVIEDDSFVRKVIGQQLEKSTVWHFIPDFAETMESALCKLKEGTYNIVLSDLELPDSRKESTMMILSKEFASLPYVILTGMDDDNLLVQSIQAGARNYLSKDYLQLGSLLSRTLFNALEHWKMEAELYYTATHDPLTGAVNKKYFHKLLGERIEMYTYDNSLFSLALCDLDNFRGINNSYGHMAGDGALRIFVETLRETVRSRDIIGRFGGDEFCLLFPGTDRDKCSSFLKKLSGLKIELPGVTEIRGSYGGVVYKPGMTAEDLIIEADIALYEVKEKGKGFSLVR